MLPKRPLPPTSCQVVDPQQLLVAMDQLLMVAMKPSLAAARNPPLTARCPQRPMGHLVVPALEVASLVVAAAALYP